MTTKVVHCKKEKYDVYIGRPSEFGNPYSHKEGTLAEFKTKTRSEAIQKCKEWVIQQPELLLKIRALKDKTLGCWCKPLACHGDIYVAIADNFEEFIKNNEPISSK